MTPLVTTFAGDSARGEGLFAAAGFVIGAPYWAETSSSVANNLLSNAYNIWGSYVDTLGNVYQLVQNTNGFAVQKFNLSGTLLLTTSTFTGFSASPLSNNNLTVDSSGNIYITGSTVGIPGGGVVAKLNSSGTLQWSRARIMSGFGGGFFSSPFIDSSGNLWVSSTLNDNGGTGYIFASFYKYNSSGTLLNTYSFNTASTTFGCNAQTIDSSGNIIGVGYNATSPFIISFSSSTGTRNWSQTLNLSSTGSKFSSVVTDSSNNIYTAGLNTNLNQAIIVKYNSSGTVQWQYNTGIACNNGYFPTLIIDSLGNPILGTTDASGGYTYLIKLSPSGTATWVDRFYLYTLPSPPPVTVNTMFNDPANNIYIGGTYSTASSGAGIPGAGYLLKLLGDGSKTGSYTVGNSSLVISSSSVTLTSSSYTTIAVTPGTAADNSTSNTTKITVTSASTIYNANAVL